MAVYPTGLVTTTDIPNAGANLSTNPHSSLHDEMRDEIVAIEAELGVAPSGSSATLAARLNIGWQHIATATFSAASTVDITIPASTYYTVHITIVASIAAGIEVLQARVNNDSTASLHRDGFASLLSDATITNTSVGTAWDIGAISTFRSVTNIDINDCDGSSTCPMQGISTVYGASEANSRAKIVNGSLAAARTISSIRIFPAASTMTGRYVCSGYRLP